jgi:1-acyl-sn-glycerol-3-phosphate acyltransferase
LATSNVIIFGSEIDRYRDAGTALVAPTHRSFLDLTAVSILGDRAGEGQPFFLSKRENIDNRVTAWALGHARTFPIDRDMSDPRWKTVFMKWGRYAMGSDSDKGEQNRKLVMFPEATRKDGDIVEDLEPGTLVLAGRLKVPIIPVGIVKKRKNLSVRPTVLVTVGEPFRAGLKDLDLLAEKMQEQYDRAKRTLDRLI